MNDMADPNTSPNLKKLSIALLEALVKPAIGEKAIDILRAPVDEQELIASINLSLEKTEQRFIAHHQNCRLAELLLSLPLHNLSSLQNVVRKFYDDPTGTDIRLFLEEKMSSEYANLAQQDIQLAVEEYLHILKEEIITVSEEICQKIGTLALLDIQENTRKISHAIGSSNQKLQQRIGTLPPLPSLVIGRDNDVLEIKQKLGIGNSVQTDGSQTFQIIIRGWPGVGKTTIASVLAHDNDVQSQFSDGVLWISLGPKPNLLSLTNIWGRALTSDSVVFGTVEEAFSRLSDLLRDKSMLLIIDDVWETAHALPFQVGGKNCATLITTRANQIAFALARTPGNIYRLPVLTEDNSLALLRFLAPSIVGEYPDECRQLVIELEGLPLALQVAGRMLVVQARYGFSVADLLVELQNTSKILAAKAPADRSDVANETSPTVAALLMKSTDRLDDFTRMCFAQLGVFAPKPASFDLEALKDIWEVDAAEPIARRLVDYGLLEPVPELKRFQLHGLLVAHANYILT